ncbi:alkanesulfonate monooxygenase SsuD/methylene tetrahydromethanopterin reductase-like flavin-dependent oxidoreductase (luciferase family) [Stackebrandtia albiflava]|uniref:Alkanesulfonate monooxygenase SsuD/methylene tetrahydromethanopterin reductase-like flavin-dependent oxidoreductase (Luciferase family) n=1 Tax=Stackebrandtia albiflava TaxID=406432 RepID=A0A562VB70_9ACTN|nr:LLM class flavin-dependent oxidoreductase [Stackebrandtia albiflava]TWJ15091.1 alkanesulfonate monooxygenase SsuD/methylene tetrahydromethanopterin reductase-like flavin-dependent oxidoreductase (luciferase family) [Stackebrandtia albiflava]
MHCDLFLVGDAVHTPAAGVPAAILEYSTLAEKCGFGGVWLAEHHFIRYGGAPSATVMASAVLSATERLRVGTAACVLSHRHPVALGEEAVMLDGLSGGRFRLGVARGGDWVELEVFGAGRDRYAHGFPESLDLLLEWLSGATEVGASGRFFRFRPVRVPAAPANGLGVWVAATSPASVDPAARRGLPLLLGVHATDEEKAALVRRWRRVAEQHGHDPTTADHTAVYLAYPADSDRVARRRLREPMTEWLTTGVGDYRRLDGSRVTTAQDEYVDRLIATHPVGTVETAAARLAEAREVTGIDRVMLMVEGAGSTAEVAENIARIGAELLPIVSPPPS